MSNAERNSSFSSSTTSWQLNSHDNSETVKVKNYIKDLLKSRIFLGRYLERRLVNHRSIYRDIVVVSPAEVELKRDLLEALCKLRTITTDQHWIGITNSEVVGNNSGLCIWTEIDDQPFGVYWFQIKSVKFRDDEIMLLLKCIRLISDSFLELEPILTGMVKKKVETGKSKTDVSLVALNESYNDIRHSLNSALSIKNVKEFFTFLFVFVIAIFTGSTSFVNFLGNFVLALVREMSILIKNSTPMFLGILDFFGKIIGGFYILLAMFFKPNCPVKVNKRSFTYLDQPHRQYNGREFD